VRKTPSRGVPAASGAAIRQIGYIQSSPRVRSCAISMPEIGRRPQMFGKEPNLAAPTAWERGPFLALHEDLEHRALSQQSPPLQSRQICPAGGHVSCSVSMSPTRERRLLVDLSLGKVTRLRVRPTPWLSSHGPVGLGAFWGHAAVRIWAYSRGDCAEPERIDRGARSGLAFRGSGPGHRKGLEGTVFAACRTT
jgi:hypothetical protein